MTPLNAATPFTAATLVFKPAGADCTVTTSEPLPPSGEQGAGGLPRRPEPPFAGDGYGQRVRFDDTAPEDDLGLKLRPPLTEPPISEPERPQEDAGSDEP